MNERKQKPLKVIKKNGDTFQVQHDLVYGDIAGRRTVETRVTLQRIDEGLREKRLVMERMAKERGIPVIRVPLTPHDPADTLMPKE